MAINTETHNCQCAEHRRLQKARSCMGRLFGAISHSHLRDHQGRGLRKMLRARGCRQLEWNSFLDAVGWIHTWTHHSGDYTSKACTRSAWIGEVVTKPHPSQGAARNWWRWDSFLQGCGLWEAIHIPAGGPIPTHIQAALNGLSGF